MILSEELLDRMSDDEILFALSEECNEQNSTQLERYLLRRIGKILLDRKLFKEPPRTENFAHV